MLFLEIIIVTFLGLVLGSFSTALAYRIPRKISWGFERSSCPNCKSTLEILDLFPVFSWCFSGGKCRHCLNKISYRYPFTEIISTVMCLVIYYVFGFNVASSLMMACVPILIALFLIDLEYMILPNHLVFILFLFGLANLTILYMSSSDADILYYLFTQYIGGAVLYAGISWFLGFLLTKILKRDSLGFGDVKFFFVSGLWLGIEALPYFMIISGLLAILFALIWRVFRKEDIFPFGPALIMSFYILLILQGLPLFGKYVS